MLLRKQREFEELKKVHEMKRAEYEQRMKECEAKRKELDSKRSQMQERMKKFEKFIKENDAKKTRATLKAISERKATEIKELERSLLGGELEEQQERMDRYAKLMGKAFIIQTLFNMYLLSAKLKKFEGFLINVVINTGSNNNNGNNNQVSGSNSNNNAQNTNNNNNNNVPEGSDLNINDILMRYKTLSETNADLMEAMQSNSDRIEKLQLKLMQMQSHRSEQTLRLNSEINRLKEANEKQSSRTSVLEQSAEEMQVSGKQKMRLLSQANLAIEDLFIRSFRPLSNSLNNALDAALGGMDDGVDSLDGTKSVTSSSKKSTKQASSKASSNTNLSAAAAAAAKKASLQAARQAAEARALSYAEKLRIIQDKISDTKDVIDKVVVMTQKEKVKNADMSTKKSQSDQEKANRQKAKEQEMAMKRATVNNQKPNHSKTALTSSNSSLRSSQSGSYTTRSSTAQMSVTTGSVSVHE